MGKKSWAVELRLDDANRAHKLRLIPGIEARVSEIEGTLWLRGSELQNDAALLLDQLPCLRRFNLLDEGEAVPQGKTVPILKLSGSDWVPLRHVTSLGFPTPIQHKNYPSPVTPRLEPSARELPANMLIVSFSDWHAFAVRAAEIRLRPLRYAVSDDRRAAIFGQPLPPLLGDYYALIDRIAVPCGTRLSPAINHSMLAEHYRLKAGDVLVFHRDGSSELLDSSGISQASRNSVRATHDSLKSTRSIP